MSVTDKRLMPVLPALVLGWLLLPLIGMSAQVQEDGGHDAASASDCLRCHEPIKEQIRRSVPHEPAADEDCSLCHTPHAARYENLLTLRERALCFACHREQALSFMTGSVHTPMREGDCVSCHDVHGSEHESLLTVEGNELCFRCHDLKRQQMDLRSIHEPFSTGECVDCHDPHNSAHPQQLLGPANAMCNLCHEPDAAELVEAHYEIPVKGTDCVACHDAHASIHGGLLLPIMHEPFADGSCEMCHLVEGPNPLLLRATGARLCNACHKNYPRTGDTFVHEPVAKGECSSCHDAHATRTPHLLVSNPETGCLDCHAEIGERARTAKSAHPFQFDGGGSCTACHQPHSSTQEHLLTAGGIRTCLGCHETMRHGHPLGEDRLDPRTGSPITCVTCHDPHGSEFAMQLRGEKTRGLCIECHKDDN